MGFKLVRVDAIEPCKVFLPVGSHLIGRGKFLNCHDHRVSRKHAELIVTPDSVLLKSLHQNPCFYKKRLSEETKIFSQPDSQILSNGDQFGLIPDTFWYEVIYCPDNSQTDDCEKTSNELNVCVEKDNQEIIMNGDTDSYEREDREKLNYSSDSVLCERSTSPSLLPAENQSSPSKDAENGTEMLPQNNPEDMETATDLEFDPESLTQLNELMDGLPESTDHPAESINQPTESVAQPAESVAQPAESVAQPAESTNQLAEPTHQLAEPTNEPAESMDQTKEPTDQNVETNQHTFKRAHSQESPSDAKKVKIEPGEPSTNENVIATPQTVKTEPASPQDVKPGPSNNQGSSSNNGSNNPPAMPQSPTKPPNRPLRERCMYGANCYRRNPQHKATYSHPSDGDWGSGEQAACPWGGGCRRADPRHWRDHHHPPGTQPPPWQPRPGRRQRRQNSGIQRMQSPATSDSNSDSGVEASLIVTGKRARKPVVRQGWSDSEENEDPYQTDDSDEWEGPSM